MKNVDKQLTGLAESMVAYGKKQGADEVQITISEGSELSIDVRMGNIEKLVEAGSKRLSVKVIKDSKVATASSSDLSKETLNKLMDHAIQRAELASADEFSSLPESQKITADLEALQIYDGSITELAVEKKIEFAKKTESICLADERVKKSYGASYGSFEGTFYLANSNGVSLAYPRTSCSCSIYLQSGDGDNLFDDGWGDATRNLSDLMTPEDIAKTAIHRVTRLIGAKKIETQNVPVIMEPAMTSSLLRFLQQCITGRSIYLKQSFLTDKLCQQIAGKNISIVDDGLLPRGIGSRPFDSEGVPSQKTSLIEQGVLKNYLLDTYASKKLGLPSTGNAGGSTNFYMEAGIHSQEEIIKSVDKGLYLADMIGQGTVPTTGDISRGAFGLWIDNGELTYPVAEITISGNLGTILNQIEMVGNDLEHKDSIEGPTIKIAEMTIGGK
ncbi:TldD/PmbA family protein [candidate division KSB1 bacterium]|nr:TldD/PmbA family protein [candidate division KSB1 bacterium]